MKYIITDQGEVRIGHEYQFHRMIADGVRGRVNAAGYCEMAEDGTYRVFGESLGFSIGSKPEDVWLLNHSLHTARCKTCRAERLGRCIGKEDPKFMCEECLEKLDEIRAGNR